MIGHDVCSAEHIRDMRHPIAENEIQKKKKQSNQ